MMGTPNYVIGIALILFSTLSLGFWFANWVGWILQALGSQKANVNYTLRVSSWVVVSLVLGMGIIAFIYGLRFL